MTKNWLGLLLAPLLVAGIAGCDVDVEDRGEAPTVDVEPGRAPDVDVHGPEVETGTETVEVPTVDVDVPDEHEN